MGLSVRITPDDVICDAARCSREVAGLREGLAPMAFEDVHEFLLDFAK